MATESRTPEEGWLIRTSTTYAKSTIHVINIADRTLVGAPLVLRNLSTSDNVVAFLGICHAIHLSIEMGYKGNIYVSNSYSYGWAQEGSCNSKVPDKNVKVLIAKLAPLVEDWATRQRVVLWQPRWIEVLVARAAFRPEPIDMLTDYKVDMRPKWD